MFYGRFYKPKVLYFFPPFCVLKNTYARKSSWEYFMVCWETQSPLLHLNYFSFQVHVDINNSTKDDTIASLEILHSFQEWMLVVDWCLGWNLSRILRMNHKKNQISLTSWKNEYRLYNLEVYIWIITWSYRDRTTLFSHISLIIEQCCLLNPSNR